MALVSLGRERDPSSTGTEGLLSMAVGGAPGFNMVEFEFYKEQLENFKVILQRNAGSMSWVIGGRGTGKSEVLSHLFRESIMENPSRPRLPIYISITDREERERYQDRRVQSGKGRDEDLDAGSVTMGLFNYLCSQSLLEALAYLRSVDEHVGDRGRERFSLLRKCISNQTFYESLTDKDNGELSNTEFSLLDFMKTIRKNKAASEAFRLAIICDDFDKLSVDAAQTFFSNAQNDFQTLSGTHKVVIVSSVTKEFVNAAKGNPEMSYCMSQTPAERKVELGELWVPDISELTSGELQEFINHRIRHLHWDGVSWTFDPDLEPHDTVQEVIRSKDWDSYDPTRMRVNGALLELNAWLSRRDEVSMRQIISCLDTVLRSDPDSPKNELTPVQLESTLKRNDTLEKELIFEKLRERVLQAGVTTKSLDKGAKWFELAEEEKQLGDDARWEALCTVVVDKVALGKWRKTRLAIMEGKKPGLMAVTENYSQKSGIFQFIKLVSELAESDDWFEEVLSRTPDEVFKKISPRNLALEFNKMAATSMAKKKVPAKKKAPASQVPANEVGRSVGIVRSAYEDALEDCDLEWASMGDWDSLEKTQFAHSMAFWLVRHIIGVGPWAADKPGVKSSYESDERGFVNTLMQWFSMLLSTENPDECELIHALHEVLRGKDPMALATLAYAQGDPFDKLQHRRKFIGATEFLDDFYTDLIIDGAPMGFEVSLEFESPEWRGLGKVMKGLKIDSTQPIFVDVLHTPGYSDGLEDDMVQLTHWLDLLNSELREGELRRKLRETSEPGEYRISKIHGEYLQMIPHFVKLEVDVTFETNRTEVWAALLNARDSSGISIPWVDIKSTGWDKKGFTIKGDISRSHYKEFKSLEFIFKGLDSSQSRDGMQAPYRMFIENKDILNNTLGEWPRGNWLWFNEPRQAIYGDMDDDDA